MARQVEEQSLGKRFSLWFRKNEKLFWVVLLVLVCLSFGATFIMTQVLSDPYRKTFCAVGGRSYSIRDMQRMTRWFNDIGKITQGAPRTAELDYSMLTQSSMFSRNAEDRHVLLDILVPFLAAVKEAEELGLEIPPDRIYDVAKECYIQGATAEAIRDATRTMNAKEREEFREKKRHEQIAEETTWSPGKYRSWLEDNGFAVRDFERAVEMLLRVQTLRELFLSSDVVSRKDLYESFVRENRKLKLALAVIEKESVVKNINVDAFTDEELNAYYREQRQDFVLPVRLSFEYIKFPLQHFEKEATVTDEEIQKRYERDRTTKYLANPASPPPAVIYPLTPKEQAEEAEVLKTVYTPLAEVRDTIKSELQLEAARSKAASFATSIKNRLSKPAEGADAATAPPVTPESIAAEYEFVTAGTTPDFDEKNAEKQLDDLYAKSAVDRWFREFKEGNALFLPQLYLTSKRTVTAEDGTESEETTYFLVQSVAAQKSETLDWNLDTERCKEIAREKLAEAKAADAMREIAEKFIVKLREGTPITEVAADHTVYVTEPFTRETINEMTYDDEKVPSPLNYQIAQPFFTDLELDATVAPRPVEDTENGRVFVCAIDEIVEQPDSGEFDETKEKELRRTAEQRQRFDRIRDGWGDYLRNLVVKHAKIYVEIGQEKTAPEGAKT